MKAKGWIILAAVVVVTVLGFLFFRGVPPEVILPSETIFTIGNWDVRNTILTSWVVVAFLVIVSFLGTRNSSLVPVRFLQNFVEAVLEWAYGVVEDVAGEANARRFFPLVGTIFLYVICSNWFGLLPIYGTIGITRAPEPPPSQTAHATIFHKREIGPLSLGIEPIHPQSVEVQADKSGEPKRTDGQPLVSEDGSHFAGTLIPFFRSVFSDANAPLSIALVSFVFVEYWGLSTLGVGTYLGKFFNFKAILSGQPLGIIDIFVGLLELLSEFIRIVSFTFRLLGNIFAGEVLLVFMTFLVPFVVPTLFYSLELFVGLIQASVFALLTLVFAVMAVSHHEEGEHAGAGHDELELEPA